MKVLQISLISLTVGSSAAVSLRGDRKRDLQVLYYPRYTGDYNTAWCSTTDNYAQGSQGKATELECCNSYFPNQASGKCYSMLPAPPTVSPTGVDGPNIWYANFDIDFADGVCINTAPAPNGRNTYDTQLECCQEEYATQTTGACVADLPNPPTVSPTATGGPDAWYSNNADWEIGECINTAPVPSGRTVYDSQLECCKGAYGTQESGYCFTQLPNPPTVSPTATGGPDAWYSNNAEWEIGACINTAPVPSGRTVYDSQLECCKGAYGTQESGYCFTQLPNPPTVSPTATGGPDAWYSNNADWEIGECINTAPVPSGRTVYDTQLECCKGAYGTQESGYCFTQLPNPPTVSPTATGGPDAWYANFDIDWADGVCINTAPVPNGRVVYDSQLDCCKGAYNNQPSGACLAALPNPPTVSPTATGGPDAWYSNNAEWALGECINTAPVPSGRTVYDTQLECCKGAYGTQESGYCFTQLPNPPTVSPTATGGPDAWYSNDAEWALGECINTAPVPNGRTVYDTQLECCKGVYSTQESGYCFTQLPNPPTVSPTATGGPDAWYANFDLDWADGVCINTAPVPSGRIVYDSQLECCKGAYGSQDSGACLADLPNPPTVSPTATGGPDAWYSNNAEWSIGECINTAPVPSGRTVYDTQLECCKGVYGTQESGYCFSQLPTPPTAAPIGSDAEFFPIWSDAGFEASHCDNDPTKRTNNYSYATQAECCEAWFLNQASGACMNFDPTYGSKSPTQAPIQ